uniref:DUF866-domain-containing protein n=1 Tax=Arcella intermedia TaxID=1963864 RepID=A0A6B2LHF6_9EUKA
MHNIEKIVPVSDARWAIKYKCNNCSCITDKFVGISRDISVQNRSGRGEVNLDFSCKSCKRVNKITITNPHEDAPYDAIKKSDKHPKALLGLSVHGSAEPIEIDLEACGPWEASYKVHGKTKTEEISFTLPSKEEENDEQESYDSDDDYKNQLPKFRWYKEGEDEQYFRVDKIRIEIHTDKQLPEEYRARDVAEASDEEDEKAKAKPKGKKK